MKQIRQNLQEGRREVYDADLSSYFDSIPLREPQWRPSQGRQGRPYDRLMTLVEKRIADRSVLELIRMWLRTPVVEEGGRGDGKRPDKGTPQGGVISPLLANLYLHEMDRAFYEDKTGPYRMVDARLVRYADDFVVLARYQGKRIREWVEGKLEKDLGLLINRDKTSIVRMNKPGGSLNFLGFTMRYDRDLKGGKHMYLNIFPSEKAVSGLQEKIRGKTCSGYKKPLTEAIAETNVVLKGWANYFGYGYPRKVFRDVNHFVRCRFQRFLRNRSQRRSQPFRQGESLYSGLKRYGLVYL